eukprot:6196957-Pleurochrysis_carterae.AAC.2
MQRRFSWVCSESAEAKMLKVHGASFQPRSSDGFLKRYELALGNAHIGSIQNIKSVPRAEAFSAWLTQCNGLGTSRSLWL